MFESIQLWADSLGKGVVYDESRGRYCITPRRCAVQLEQSLGIPVVNHSRMGATAPEGLADFLAAPPVPGALAPIAYGGNDCDMPWADISAAPDGEHSARVPLPQYTQTLLDFVAAARARGMTPLLVTPPPLDARRYFAWVSRGLSAEHIEAFLGDVEHIYRWQERYANAVRDVAQKARCALFDLRDALLAQRRYPTLLCQDGIHLNASGHDAIAGAAMGLRGGIPPLQG